jgi:hypothetical protein
MKKIDSILSGIQFDTETEFQETKMAVDDIIYANGGDEFYFDEDEDSPELTNIIFDIADLYDLDETLIYFAYIESKYSPDGKITNSFEDFKYLFSVHITILINVTPKLGSTYNQ